MKKDTIETLFENLTGNFDTEAPADGHGLRFLQKLELANRPIVARNNKAKWLKYGAIAASITLIAGLAIVFSFGQFSKNDQVAQISPEVSQTQFYFANLLEQKVRALETSASPETQKIIDDTLLQLKRLEANYKTLEQDLLNGGNSKMILSAMITNFQTRIDLLKDVTEQIETIKNIKSQNDANFTI